MPAPRRASSISSSTEADDADVNNYGYEYKGADVIVQKLLAVAIEQRCSDMHIETLSNRIASGSASTAAAGRRSLARSSPRATTLGREMVSRFKILAKLDIAERRRPQDGSFRVRVTKGDQLIAIDLRVSIVRACTARASSSACSTSRGCRRHRRAGAAENPWCSSSVSC